MIAATSDDVRACYRLFLGREPDSAGERTYLTLVASGQFPAVDLAELFWSSTEAAELRARRARAASRLETVELDGFRMTVAPQWNSINAGIARDRVYEPYITEHLRGLINPGTVFVDIGANVGYYALLAATRGAEVHAVEPNSRNLWLLDKNAKDNGVMINIWPYVLADSERLIVYNPLRGNGQVSELSDNFPTEEQEVFRAVTLDGILGGVRPDVLKIDVEGAEGMVLRGAQKVLDCRPIVISEFSATSIPRVSGMSAEAYLENFVVRDYAFKVFGHDGTLEDVSAEQLEAASVNSEINFVDFMALPKA